MMVLANITFCVYHIVRQTEPDPFYEYKQLFERIAIACVI